MTAGSLDNNGGSLIKQQAFNDQLKALSSFKSGGFLIVNKNENDQLILSTTKNILKVFQEECRNLWNGSGMRNKKLLEAATIDWLCENKDFITKDKAADVEKLAARVGYVARPIGPEADEKRVDDEHEELSRIVDEVSKGVFPQTANSTLLDDFFKRQEPEFSEKYKASMRQLAARVSVLSSNLKFTSITQAALSAPKKSRTTVSEASLIRHYDKIRAHLIKPDHLPLEVKALIQRSIHFWQSLVQQQELEFKPIKKGSTPLWRSALYISALPRGLPTPRWHFMRELFNPEEPQGRYRLDEAAQTMWHRDSQILEFLRGGSLKRQLETCCDDLTWKDEDIVNCEPNEVLTGFRIGLEGSQLKPALRANAEVVAKLLLPECQKRIDASKEQVKAHAVFPKFPPKANDEEVVNGQMEWACYRHLGRMIEQSDCSTIQGMIDLLGKIEAFQADKPIWEKKWSEASPVVASIMRRMGDDANQQRNSELTFLLIRENSPCEDVDQCFSHVLEEAQKVFNARGIVLKAEGEVWDLTPSEFRDQCKALEEDGQLQQWTPKEKASVELAKGFMTNAQQMLEEHTQQIAAEQGAYPGKPDYSNKSCKNIVSMLATVEEGGELEQTAQDLQEREGLLQKRLGVMIEHMMTHRQANPALVSLMEKRMALYTKSLAVKDVAEKFIKDLEHASDEYFLQGMGGGQPKSKLVNQPQTFQESIEAKEQRLSELEGMLKQLEMLALLHDRLNDYENVLRQVRHHPSLAQSNGNKSEGENALRELMSLDNKTKVEKALKKLTLLKTAMPVPGQFRAQQIPIDQLDLVDADIVDSSQIRFEYRHKLAPEKVPKINTLAAYIDTLHEELIEVKRWLEGDAKHDGLLKSLGNLEVKISPQTRPLFNKLHVALKHLVAVADENGALRKALGKWLGSHSEDNQALNGFLEDNIPLWISEAELFARFKKFFKLVDKGLTNSNQLQVDAEGNVHFANEGLADVYQGAQQAFQELRLLKMSPERRPKLMQLHTDLCALAEAADKEGALRKALRTWSGSDSEDNQMLNDLLAFDALVLNTDEEAFDRLTKCLVLIEKGLTDSSQLGGDEEGNLVSDNEELKKAYEKVLDSYKNASASQESA